MRRTGFTISLNGIPDDIELALRDRGGIRATRSCTSGSAARDLLHGWFREHGCPVLALLNDALDEAAPEVAQTVEGWQICEPDRESRLRFLRPAAAMRGLQLASSSKRPQEIIDLRREIEVVTREAVRRAEAERRTNALANGGDEEIQRIVGLKLQLDGLYGAWMEGETP